MPAFGVGTGRGAPLGIVIPAGGVDEEELIRLAAGAEGMALGVVTVADRIKATSRQAVAELRALGVTRCCSPATTTAPPER